MGQRRGPQFGSPAADGGPRHVLSISVADPREMSGSWPLRFTVAGAVKGVPTTRASREALRALYGDVGWQRGFAGRSRRSRNCESPRPRG